MNARRLSEAKGEFSPIVQWKIGRRIKYSSETYPIALLVLGICFWRCSGYTALKDFFLMQDKRGNWIGFLISALCFSFLLFVVFSTVNPSWDVGWLLSSLCHQLDDRCYTIGGVPLPICVRCLWIYLGLAVGHLLFLGWRPSTDRITRVLIGVIGLMTLDVLLEKVGFYHNLFWTRAVTGFLFGFVVSHFTLLGLREIFSELSNPITYVRSRFTSGRTR